MATYSELGKSAKAKYPQYQGKSDEEVGKALAAKYPQYQAKITPEGKNDKYNRGILGFINKNASKPAAFLNVLPRLGESAVRGVAATVSQPLIPKEKRGFSSILKEAQIPFKGGKSIAEESIAQIARAEQQFPKAGKYLAPAAAVGAQLTEAFGDPQNLAMGAGLMLKFGAGATKTKGFSKLADYFFTPSQKKATAKQVSNVADDVPTNVADNIPTPKVTNTIDAPTYAYKPGTYEHGTDASRLANILDNGIQPPKGGKVFVAEPKNGINRALETINIQGKNPKGIRIILSDDVEGLQGIDASNLSSLGELSVGEAIPNNLIKGIVASADNIDDVRNVVKSKGLKIPVYLDPNVKKVGLDVPTSALAPSSRANQSIIPDIQTKIETDPAFLKRIDELGGGRVKSNVETINAGVEQVRSGKMTIEKLANHKAGTPVNEADVAAGAILRDHYEQQYVQALNAGDAKAADAANAVLTKIDPGYNNLTATPGRATQIQSQFVDNKLKGIYTKIRELQSKNVSFEVVSKELNKELRTLKRAEFLGKLGERAGRTLRALENYATGAKLTSPVTHAINTISNTITFLTRGVERSIKAGLYAAKGDTKTASGIIRSAFGTRMGFKNGAQRFLRTLVDDAPDYGLKVENQLKEVSRMPKALRLANPFRWLAAADNFWKGIIQDSEIYAKAYTFSKKSGLSGKGLSSQIAALVKNPPKAWIDDALEVSKEFTFQSEPDKFLKAILKVRNIPGGRLIVPFVQTPYNLVKFQFQRSLPGLLSSRNIKGLATGGEKAAEALSRLAIGTGLSVAAWQLVQNGEVTGAYPNDKGERELWEAEGRKPYSIKIGSKWLSYNRFQPVGLYLTQAAALDDIIKAKQDPGEAFSKFLGYTSKAILDLPFIQGFSGVLDAIQDPENYASKALSNIITGFIPNISRDIRGLTDENKRETEGIKQNVFNAVPGLSTKLQPKVDILGKEIKYEKSPLLRESKVLSTLTQTKATTYLRNVGYSPVEVVPKLEISRGNKTYEIQLSPEETTKFLVESGKATEKAILTASSDQRVTSLPKESQAYIVEKLISAAREQVKTKWKLRLAGRLKLTK